MVVSECGFARLKDMKSVERKHKKMSVCDHTWFGGCLGPQASLWDVLKIHSGLAVPPGLATNATFFCFFSGCFFFELPGVRINDPSSGKHDSM